MRKQLPDTEPGIFPYAKQFDVPLRISADVG